MILHYLFINSCLVLITTEHVKSVLLPDLWMVWYECYCAFTNYRMNQWLICHNLTIRSSSPVDRGLLTEWLKRFLKTRSFETTSGHHSQKLSVFFSLISHHPNLTDLWESSHISVYIIPGKLSSNGVIHSSHIIPVWTHTLYNSPTYNCVLRGFKCFLEYKRHL